MTFVCRPPKKQTINVIRPRLPWVFSCSSTCLTYRPLAKSCAPFLDMARKSRSPLLSMNVTSLRSIMQARLSWLLCALFQVVLSSLTHGPTKHPCTIHLLSVGVSVMVIFSTPTSHVCCAHAPGYPQGQCRAECGSKSLGRRFRCCLANLFLGCAPDPSAYEPRCLRAQTRPRPSPTSLGGGRDRAPLPTFRPPTGREPLLDQILAPG